MLKFQQPGMYISINSDNFFCILLSFKKWSEQHIQENMSHATSTKNKKTKKQKKKDFLLQL